MHKFLSTKIIELGSTAFRQPNATSHCKYIHGYRLKAKIWFATNELDENNWVFDFGGLKDLKKNLEKTFDHKLVIDKNDPAKTALKEVQRYGAADIVEMDGVGIEKFAEHVFKTADVFVKFNSNNRVWVEKVEVFEHENNSAIFEKQCCSEATTEIVEDAAQNKKEEPQEPSNQEKTNEEKPHQKISEPSKREPVPASFGNKVTTGWSNPFGGTSWGA
jgi:6-pyruvoyltetrahydropterin/6-carboxytetrahydropterin synthase